MSSPEPITPEELAGWKAAHHGCGFRCSTSRLIREVERLREASEKNRTFALDQRDKLRAAESALAEATAILVGVKYHVTGTAARAIDAFLARPEGKPAERCAACTTGQHRSCDQRAGNVCGCECHAPAPAVEGPQTTEEEREINAGLGRFQAFKELGDWHDYRANEIRGDIATGEQSRQRREELEVLADEHDECARHHRGERSKFDGVPTVATPDTRPPAQTAEPKRCANHPGCRGLMDGCPACKAMQTAEPSEGPQPTRKTHVFVACLCTPFGPCPLRKGDCHARVSADPCGKPASDPIHDLTPIIDSGGDLVLTRRPHAPEPADESPCACTFHRGTHKWCGSSHCECSRPNVEERLAKLEAVAHEPVSIPIGNIEARLAALEARVADAECVPCRKGEDHLDGVEYPCGKVHAPEPAAEPPTRTQGTMTVDPDHYAATLAALNKAAERNYLALFDDVRTAGAARLMAAECWCLRLATRPHFQTACTEPSPTPTSERAPADFGIGARAETWGTPEAEEYAASLRGAPACSSCGGVLTVGERAAGVCAHCAPDPVAAPAEEGE